MNLPIDQVLHGDCIEIMNALPEKCVDLVFADPPYNLQLGGELWRPNLTKVDAVDDPWDRFGSFEEYDAFTRQWLTAARRVMKDTATLWVIATYHAVFRLGAVLQDLGFWILNDVVWIKLNPMPQFRGVRFCNAHETLIWAKKSREQAEYTFHYRGLKAGNEDKQMRSDWYFPICSGRERVTVNGQKAHTTQKPEALLHRILVATSRPGDLILDPFCGVGTTAAVAKRLGRRFITMDREFAYVEAAAKRIAAVIPAQPNGEATPIEPPKPRVPFVSLVEGGALPVGGALRLRKSEVVAIINADGTITANGYRGSIHKVAALCLGVPSCNGWTHWLYADPDTAEWRPLDDLRAAALTPPPPPYTGGKENVTSNIPPASGGSAPAAP